MPDAMKGVKMECIKIDIGPNLNVMILGPSDNLSVSIVYSITIQYLSASKTYKVFVFTMSGLSKKVRSFSHFIPEESILLKSSF